MPIHDWTQVDEGLFHAFRQSWIGTLCDALNTGGLPSDHFALLERRIQSQYSDMLQLELPSSGEEAGNGVTGLAVATAPPRTRLIRKSDAEVYARKADRITVRHRHGDVVAVIEIVSPGNKASRGEFRAFVQKSVDLVLRGIHLLVIDLFPPGKRDPQGVAKAVWDEFEEDDVDQPLDKPLLLASIDAGPPRVYYAEPVAVGDLLPDMPIFLKPETYVPTPLEPTYQATWKVFPAALKGLLEGSGT